MKAEIKNGELVLTLPLHAPKPSASGKTNIVFSTGGFAGTGQAVGGKPISVSINATVPR